MLRSMAVFSRRVDATVVALTWKRSVVVEQAHWVPRRTAWKPHGDNVRNLRTVQVNEPGIMSDVPVRGAGLQRTKSGEVLTTNTYYEYEELRWRRLRSFSAKGDGPEDVRWPEYTLEPEQRISEQRATYHATFSVAGAASPSSAGDPGSGAAEYTAELDEATWRALEAGRQCRLTVGAFSDEVKRVTPLPGSRR
jgi:hypothetical protein